MSRLQTLAPWSKQGRQDGQQQVFEQCMYDETLHWGSKIIEDGPNYQLELSTTQSLQSSASAICSMLDAMCPHLGDATFVAAQDKQHLLGALIKKGGAARVGTCCCQAAMLWCEGQAGHQSCRKSRRWVVWQLRACKVQSMSGTLRALAGPMSPG